MTHSFLNLLKTKNNLIDLSIGWQLSAGSLNSTISNGLFYEKCNENLAGLEYCFLYLFYCILDTIKLGIIME